MDAGIGAVPPVDRNPAASERNTMRLAIDKDRLGPEAAFRQLIRQAREIFKIRFVGASEGKPFQLSVVGMRTRNRCHKR